jgi:hypothetical protein
VILDLVRSREGDLARRRIEIALVISLLLHGVAVWKWFPHDKLLTPGEQRTREQQPLSVSVAPSRPQTAQPPVATREAPPAPAPVPRPRASIPRPIPTPSPPVIASPAPAPAIVAPPAAPAPPPVVIAPSPPAPSPPTTDLAAYVEQRRRARGETGEAPASTDSDAARRERAIAANLASLSSQNFGEPRNGGGTFQIRRLDFDDAQFTFYGWNRDMNRRMFQVIDVRRGSNASIDIAVVRRIIAIIREHEPGDFRWHSLRLSRDMMLSARPEHTAELEAFMMEEFFTRAGRVR